MQPSRFHAVVLSATLFAFFSPPSRTMAQRQAASSAAAADDWAVDHRTYAGDRYSPLRQIPTSNVSRLQSVCTPDYMPELRPGDDLFTNSVIGLDAKSTAGNSSRSLQA